MIKITVFYISFKFNNLVLIDGVDGNGDNKVLLLEFKT